MKPTKAKLEYKRVGKEIYTFLIILGKKYFISNKENLNTLSNHTNQLGYTIMNEKEIVNWLDMFKNIDKLNIILK